MVGIWDNATSARLLREKKLTLGSALGIVKTIEMANDQIKKMIVSDTTHVYEDIDYIKKEQRKTFKTQPTDRKMSAYGEHKPQINKSNVNSNPGSGNGQSAKCKYCGRNHRKGSCPAYGKRCNGC